jgi:hypothetical protein
MALEIRRTPVLYGEDAKRFLKEIENPKEGLVSRERAIASMEQARLILAQLRAQKK